MSYSIFCLYATMRGEDDPSPWMIAAEDEYCWEGDPHRCEAVFKVARADAERNDWEVREVTLTVDIDAVRAAFLPASVAATVLRPPTAGKGET